MKVIIANAVNLSDESPIAPFIVDKDWYNQVPNFNDPYILYATCEAQEEAEQMLPQIPRTKVRAELWKQDRVLQGFCSSTSQE